MNATCIENTVDFRTLFHSLVSHIEQDYGLKVNVGPVTGFYTGQFDGKELWVDLEKDPEEAVFILVHLFGHTVQWNVDEGLRRVGLANAKVAVDDLLRIHSYERQASQIGLALIEEGGEFRLARWLSDCFGADWKFLEHYYRTGESLRFERHEGANEPLLSPLPIPKFTPHRWPPRGSF